MSASPCKLGEGLATATNFSAQARLPMSLSKLSISSPSRHGTLILRDIMSSGPATKPFTHSTSSGSAAALAAAGTAGTTRKKSHSSTASSGEDNGHSAIYGGSDENSRDGGRRSLIKSGIRSVSSAVRGDFGRMAVVGRDFVVRSSSQERTSPTKARKHHDRYIPSSDHTGSIIVPSDGEPLLYEPDPNSNDTSGLSASLGIDHSKRVLSFFAEPPLATARNDLSTPLFASYSRRPALRAATGATAQGAVTRRRIPNSPEKVLVAPYLLDDFYLNLLDWGSTNLIAIALAESVYVWNHTSGEATLLCSVGEGEDEGDAYIASVKFAEQGAHLAVGLSNGLIHVYDVTTGARMRTMRGHLSRVPSLSWSGAILSSGCRTGEIWNSDVRISQHRVAELRGHLGEVCGLRWRPEIDGGLSGGGQGLLASGGNDNIVNVWDARMTNAARVTKTNHTAAVKALAWSPWDSKLLASGGGTSDRTIHFWNTQTSARLHSLVTPSQVTSLVFNPHSREILSSHGIPNHELSLWSYPSLTKVIDIPQAHDARILHSCLSPEGTLVATAGSDENLKFWRVFDGPKRTMLTKAMGETEIDGASGFQKKGKTSIRVR